MGENYQAKSYFILFKLLQLSSLFPYSLKELDPSFNHQSGKEVKIIVLLRLTSYMGGIFAAYFSTLAVKSALIGQKDLQTIVVIKALILEIQVFVQSSFLIKVTPKHRILLKIVKKILSISSRYKVKIGPVFENKFIGYFWFFNIMIIFALYIHDNVHEEWIDVYNIFGDLNILEDTSLLLVLLSNFIFCCLYSSTLKFMHDFLDNLFINLFANVDNLKTNEKMLISSHVKTYKGLKDLNRLEKLVSSYFNFGVIGVLVASIAYTAAMAFFLTISEESVFQLLLYIITYFIYIIMLTEAPNPLLKKVIVLHIIKIKYIVKISTVKFNIK